MKRFISLLAALMLCMGIVFAQEETQSQQEEGVYYQMYTNTSAGFRIGGIPMDWAVMGIGSVEEQLSEARCNDAYSEAMALISEENDVLICAAPDGKITLMLTYEEHNCTGIDDLIRYAEDIIGEVKKSNPLWTSEQDTFTYNNIINSLCFKMTYGEKIKTRINQYYLASGRRIFVFTFFNVDDNVCLEIVNNYITIE